MKYRALTAAEIEQLEKQGCRATDWQNVQVSEEFRPDPLVNVHFQGKVHLGRFEKEIEIQAGITKQSGLQDCFIQDCTLADNVYVNGVKNLVGYHLYPEAAIENVGSLTVTGESTFGNGTEIEVLNEGGGRELPLYNQLTAQIAYLLVNYRHNQDFIKQLQKLIWDYVHQQKASHGTVETGARILNSSTVRDLNIGSHAVINGALTLENGTLVSSAEAPATIGSDVIARDFIAQEGSKIEDGAVVENCFIGQAVTIGKQFSAEHSAIFANSEFFHGEGLSIFAGPYTVSHHKSSLLIAGLFSFYNAGSGTNQSNHMYKLGPLHQGILERGSKTGSFSYLLWPARIGAFTAVIGKHYSNFDTTTFPFSYLEEDEGKSVLTPAMNLLTVGTLRDSRKWPNRDKRQSQDKLDLINFELFSPYTIGRVLIAIDLLKSLYETASRKQEYVKYKGVHIKRLLLRTTRKYYQIAINIYLGNEIVKRLKGQLDSKTSFKALKPKLFAHAGDISQTWTDLSGMIAPMDKLNRLVADVTDLKITDIQGMRQALQEIHDAYAEDNWYWCLDLLQGQLKKPLTNITNQDIMEVIEIWKDNVIKLNNMILKDARKEFDPNSRFGYGLDGDEDVKARDFAAVRGAYDQNSFVTGLQAENEQVAETAEQLIQLLKK